jgi:hypothetical protein
MYINTYIISQIYKTCNRPIFRWNLHIYVRTHIYTLIHTYKYINTYIDIKNIEMYVYLPILFAKSIKQVIGQFSGRISITTVFFSINMIFDSPPPCADLIEMLI